MAHQQDPGSRGEGEGAPLTARARTIAAIATPPGRGGIGIIRISGPAAREVLGKVVERMPSPRQARFARFRDAAGEPIDEGVVLFFPAPHSYTGEDVVELQGHGGAFVMQRLLARCLELGAQPAEPGEFTRRAFLNGRLDLAQAESVADLIDASSVEAARSAARSLVGEFSRRVHGLVEALIELRAHLEACIDFPEEEIDPADRATQERALEQVRADLAALLVQARQGAVLREGLTVVIAGPPNVGKSSLLNRLAGEDVAIVTDVPGTTRDFVRATVTLRGVPIHLVDTAGLREAGDEVERIGIERALGAIAHAGAVLLVSSACETDSGSGLVNIPGDVPTLRVVNKVDLVEVAGGAGAGPGELRVSARTGDGIDALRDWLLETAGWQPHGEGTFMARARHVAALTRAAEYLGHASSQGAYELRAEELRLAQQELGRITGEVSADRILGEIFSRFCIGK